MRKNTLFFFFSTKAWKKRDRNLTSHHVDTETWLEGVLWRGKAAFLLACIGLYKAHRCKRHRTEMRRSWVGISQSQQSVAWAHSPGTVFFWVSERQKSLAGKMWVRGWNFCDPRGFFFLYKLFTKHYGILVMILGSHQNNYSYPCKTSWICELSSQLLNVNVDAAAYPLFNATSRLFTRDLPVFVLCTYLHSSAEFIACTNASTAAARHECENCLRFSLYVSGNHNTAVTVVCPNKTGT